MTVVIDPADPRTVRALDVLATSDRWVKGHRKSDGRPFFVIPSSSGAGVYWTDCRQCTCPDAQRHPDVLCKHSVATRLWLARQRVQSVRRPHVARSTPRTAHAAAPITLSAHTLAGAARYTEIFGEDA